MTPKLRQICGCALCMIPKDIQIDLNGFITRPAKYLQQKYFWIHTRNCLFITTIDAHYKDIVFLYGEYLHATIKNSAQCITFLPIKPNNMIHIKCALSFFY